MTETGFTVSLPGIGKENIEVIDTNDTVKINWSDKRVSSSHKDSISIPVEGHSDIAAEYKDGILTVNITKKDTSKKVVIS
jgi:HSP20 family molecular chaperone IbpA